MFKKIILAIISFLLGVIFLEVIFIKNEASTLISKPTKQTIIQTDNLLAKREADYEIINIDKFIKIDKLLNSKIIDDVFFTTTYKYSGILRQVSFDVVDKNYYPHALLLLLKIKPRNRSEFIVGFTSEELKRSTVKIDGKTTSYKELKNGQTISIKLTQNSINENSFIEFDIKSPKE